MGNISNSPKGSAEDSRASQPLPAAVYRIMRTLVRVLLRHGVSFQAFADIAKRAYIDSALEDFSIPGRKPTTSRVAVLTGLTRKEVQRIEQEEKADDADAMERYNRAARVVSGWVRDKDFCNADTVPLELPIDGHASSFAELVRRYSGDIPPRAVLDELLRVGTVARTENGHLRLIERAYIPRGSDNDKLAILGADVSDLVDTIDHNLSQPDNPRFQRKLMYDNLPDEAVDKFRELSAARAQGLMEYLDSYLSQHDRDVNSQSEGSGRKRAGLGVFYFEEQMNSADPSSGEKE